MNHIVIVPLELLDVTAKYYLQIHVQHGPVLSMQLAFPPRIPLNVYVHRIKQENCASITLLLIRVLRHHVSMMPIALVSMVTPIFTVIVVMIEQEVSASRKWYIIHVHLRLVSMAVVA
jgi:hypothetical protein